MEKEKTMQNDECEMVDNQEYCCVCGKECVMNTEYEGSAVCPDEQCSVHNW